MISLDDPKISPIDLWYRPCRDPFTAVYKCEHIGSFGFNFPSILTTKPMCHGEPRDQIERNTMRSRDSNLSVTDSPIKVAPYRSPSATNDSTYTDPCRPIPLDKPSPAQKPRSRPHPPIPPSSNRPTPSTVRESTSTPPSPPDPPT